MAWKRSSVRTRPGPPISQHLHFSPPDSFLGTGVLNLLKKADVKASQRRRLSGAPGMTRTCDLLVRSCTEGRPRFPPMSILNGLQTGAVPNRPLFHPLPMSWLPEWLPFPILARGLLITENSHYLFFA